MGSDELERETTEDPGGSEDDPSGSETDRPDPPAKTAGKGRTTKGIGPSPLRVPPFQVSRMDETRTPKAYGWIDEYPGRKPPRPGDIDERYGPGRYRIVDAANSRVLWTIHGMGALPGGEEGDDDEDHDYGAPPPYAPQPRQEHPGQHQGHPPPYGQGPGGYGAPAPQGTDPYTAQTLYRLDAAVTQIHQDGRRLADELRSLRYDIELAPSRVAERVGQVIQDSRDPIDEMVRLHQVSQTMGLGGDGGGGDGGIGSVLASALSGFAQSTAGAASPPPAQAPPPPTQIHAVPQAPPLAAPQAPPAPPAVPATLAGMTPPIAAEIASIAASMGMDPDGAIAIAHTRGWDAPRLLEYARALAARQVAKP